MWSTSYQLLYWIGIVVQRDQHCLAEAIDKLDTSVITDQQIDGVLGSFIHRLMDGQDDEEHVEEVLSSFIQLMFKIIKFPELNDRFLKRMRVLIDAEMNGGQCAGDCCSNDDGKCDSKM